MTYSSRPPAPGRHHLGPAQGEPNADHDRPGGRDPAAGWGGEPEQAQSGFPPPGHPAHPGQGFPPEQPGQPVPPSQAPGGGWQDPGPGWQDQAPGGGRQDPGAGWQGQAPGGGWQEQAPGPGRQDSGPGWQGQASGGGWQDPGPGWQGQTRGGWQNPDPGWQERGPARPGAGPAWTEAPPGWQPPYQGAAELQQDYVVPPAWEPVPPPEQQHQRRPESEAISSTVRGQIVDRMIRINTSHALQAADRLGTKLAVGPHCLALFSVDNVPGRYQRLSTATRLILDGEDAENLPDLLRDLTSRAREKIAEAHGQGRRWEPRTPLTGLVLRSEEFSEQTPYIGLGVSTLDTPDIPWSRAKQRVTSADGLHLRGQGLIYLDDGTAIHLVRRAQMSSGQHEITASRRVDSQYPARRDEHLISRSAHQGDESWELMRNLHEVLLTA